MSQFIIKQVGASWQVFESADGREPYRKIGPRWATPADAGAFFDVVANMQYVNPRRESEGVLPPSDPSPSALSDAPDAEQRVTVTEASRSAEGRSQPNSRTRGQAKTRIARSGLPGRYRAR